MSTIPTVPYADTIYAAAYFAERIGSDVWNTASEANKNVALKHATRLIDRLDFVLSKTDENQANEFPRGGDTDIPEEVMMACCEVAIELLSGRVPEKMLNEDTGVTSESTGDASKSFNEQGKNASLSMASGLPSVAAAQLLRDWLEDPEVLQIVRVN